PAPHKEPAPRSGHGGAQAQSGARPHADPAPPQARPPTQRSAPARERDTPAPRASQGAREARGPDDGDARSPAKGGTEAAVGDKPAPAASAAHGSAGADPTQAGASPWWGALQLASRTPGEPGSANAGTAQDAAASSADALGQASDAADSRARSGRAATLKADARDEAARADPRAAPDADLKHASFAATLAEPQGVAKPGAAHAGAAEVAKPGIAVMSTAASTPTGAAAADPLAATSSLTLPTPIDSPDFAQALGVQLSVLAKGGVQRAELHLNPAEMGPVSVHIVMHGTQARIDFGADHAATRHAIEAGLPELAGALRDAGFTLAGGGVSQHSSHRDDGNDADHGSATRRVGGHAGGSDGDAAAAPRTRHHTVRAGGVDLFA
ncbi:MAG: flagellar hook-length control protein FliK, partial [Burkholderiaceae bacterium]